MFDIKAVQDYLYGLNQKEMMRLMMIYFVCFTLITGLLLLRHFNLLHAIEQKTKTLNKARKDIQLIMTEYEHIQNKKNEVDLILMKDKNFYIKKYYQDTIKELNITNESSSNLITQSWPNGYDEESLQINLSQISMKQLCEFLQSLQTNPRVFVKNLDISKGSIPKKINASLTIATLKLVVDKQAIRGN